MMHRGGTWDVGSCMQRGFGTGVLCWILVFAFSGGQTDLEYDFQIHNSVHSALATPIYRRWKVEQIHREICKQHRRRRRWGWVTLYRSIGLKTRHGTMGRWSPSVMMMLLLMRYVKYCMRMESERLSILRKRSTRSATRDAVAGMYVY